MVFTIILYLLLIFLVTAAGTAAFILFTSPTSDLNFHGVPKRTSNVLVVNSKGKLIDSPDDLEVELQRLNYRLSEREIQLKQSKNKIGEAKQSISKLNESKSEVQKYYAGLQHEIDKSEKERDEIKERISEYSRKAHMLKFGTSAKDICQRVLDIVQSSDQISNDD